MSVLVATGAIPPTWEEYDLKEGLRDLLVVLEMLVFAIAHYFVFSHKPYVDPAAAEVPCIAACCRMLDVRDVAGDVKRHFVDPIPRPRFRLSIRRGGGSGSGSEGAGIEGARGGDVGSSEESPLLKHQEVLVTEVARREGGVGGSRRNYSVVDRLDEEEERGGMEGRDKELSFAVLTMTGEPGGGRGLQHEHGRGSGLRARLLASQAEEEEEGMVGSTSSGASTGSSSPCGTPVT